MKTRKLRISIIMCMLLGVSGCAEKSASPELQPGQVRIVRDNFGVPHIYAGSVRGLFYGYGYAVAQDRLFQLEMTRRSTQGTVAEVLGADYLDHDKGTRANFNPASIQDQLSALEPADRDVFEGYAEGMNAWIAEVLAEPDRLMPKQFVDLGVEPGQWTAYDVVMLFVGSLANRYADFNTELENAMIVEALADLHDEETARRIFDQLNPRMTDSAPTTIPSADWPGAAPSARVDFSYTRGRLAAASTLPARDGPPGISGMSNCFVLGKDKAAGAKSILVNGPQFGWFTPSYVYSVGLHGAGFDLVGNTPFGIPAILFGHNKTIAWGSTWGAGDMVDLYQEELNPDNPLEYRHQGEFLEMESRLETIRVKNQTNVELPVLRTVHGPVVHTDEENGFAYAKRRTWDGREVESLLAWVHSTRASNYEEWLEQAERQALNINWYYADSQGNIGYAFTGKYPHRADEHDNRLPASGEGNMEWLGLQPFDLSPKVKNPSGGFIANWNNKPGAGVLNPDEFWYSWSTADRVEYLQQELASRDRWSPEEAWSLIESSSHTDVNAPYFLPLIGQASSSAGDERLKRANEILQGWSLQSRDLDRDGYYDEPATALFRAFLGQLIKTVLNDDLGTAIELFEATGYPRPGAPTGAGTNVQTGTKAIVENLLDGNASYDFLNGRPAAEIILEVLAGTLADLEAEQGPDIESWRLAVAPRPFSHLNFLGIPQAGAGEAIEGRIEQNRGTENNMIVFTEEGVVGYEVTPPGQSGFIAPDGVRSRHATDQFELYENFGKKRMWFYAQDVEKNKQSEITISAH